MQEICRCDEVAAIAHVPAPIKGAINLHGIIVPIVDQRIKFHIGDAKYDQLTARGIFGAQEFAITLNTQYVSGLGTVDERMLTRPKSSRT